MDTGVQETVKRVRLHSLEIKNLGAGGEPIALELGGEHTVLCGQNGSGKTTVLSALQCRVIEDRIESGELGADPESILFEAA